VLDRLRELRGKASGEVMTIVGPRRHLGRTKPEGIVGWLKGTTRKVERSSCLYSKTSAGMRTVGVETASATWRQRPSRLAWPFPRPF
jgi:hypothetical protein